jgi:hypothetical protein
MRFVIRSFRGKTTEAVFDGESPKGFPADLVKVARGGNCAISTPRAILATCGRLQATALRR